FGLGLAVVFPKGRVRLVRGGLSPGDGITVAGFPTTRRLRLRHFVVILGGPLANALLLAAAVWWLTPAGLCGQVGASLGGLPVGVAFALASVLMLLLSLWPYRASTPRGRLPSDGLWLWKACSMTGQEVNDIHACYFLAEAAECSREGDWAG